MSDYADRRAEVERLAYLKEKAKSHDVEGIRDIVIEWLDLYGYDGLFNAGLECGCGKADLMPCDTPDPRECKPGVKKIAGPDHEYPGEEIYGPK